MRRAGRSPALLVLGRLERETSRPAHRPVGENPELAAPLAVLESVVAGIPVDTSATSRYFKEDIVGPPVVLDEGGFIAVPEGPGIGVTIDEAALAKFTLEVTRLR